jgi:plastocyanin
MPHVCQEPRGSLVSADVELAMGQTLSYRAHLPQMGVSFASRVVASAVCLAAAVLGGCGNPTPSASLPVVDSGGAALVYVGVGDGGASFMPPRITIDAGATVEWYWVTDDHSVTSGATCSSDNAFGTRIQNTGSSFSHPFIDSGTYNYFCIEHCAMGMTGSIIVR